MGLMQSDESKINGLYDGRIGTGTISEDDAQVSDPA